MHHRHRPVALVGAPSSIGIRPYDTGEARHLDQAPGVLRELGLVERLSAADLGDVVPPPYEDFVRPPGRARNEAGVVTYSLALAERISIATRNRRFTLVLGGDCSILLGALLGAKDGSGAAIGLAYVDAHADFATPEESRTGSVASMDLALAVGRGDTALVQHPKALGLQLTIYDPALDPDRSCAARLVKLLEALSKASKDVQ